MLLIALPCFSPLFFVGFATACWNGYPFPFSIVCSLCSLLRLGFAGNEAAKTGCSSQKNKFFVTFPDFNSLFLRLGVGFSYCIPGVLWRGASSFCNSVDPLRGSTRFLLCSLFCVNLDDLIAERRLKRRIRGV